MAAELGAEQWIQGSPLGGGTVGHQAFSPSTDTHSQTVLVHTCACRGVFFERINMTNSLQSIEVLDREQLLAVR